MPNPVFISTAYVEIILLAMKEKSEQCPKYYITTNSEKETPMYQNQVLKSWDLA